MAGCCKKIYTLPTFNLQCDVHTGAMMGVPLGLRFTTVCQLVYGDLDAAITSPYIINADLGKVMYALFPKGTDIRTTVCGPLVFNDFLILPAGTLRQYQVLHVDDRWRGFTTEHRVACIRQCVGPLFAGWGFPIQ